MKKVVLSAAVCAMAFSANAEGADTASASVFSGIYGGLGVGGSFLKSTMDGMETMKANRVMGSFVIGGGKVFKNNTYLSGEVLIDFMKNRKKSYESRAKGANLQMKGFIPQVDVKLGYAARSDVLGYGKFGCALSKVSFYDGLNDRSKHKTSFVLGLGAEKAFRCKFSTAIEADYNFGFKSDDKGIGLENIKANKGWSVRALAKYNIKH